MKHFSIILFCIFISCKGHSSENKNTTRTELQQHNSKEISNINSCDDKLKTLIATSTNFNNPFKKELLAGINEEQDKIYLVELFTFDSGENTKNTIGWITLDLNNNILTDITYDPQDGNVLQYDKKLYENFVSECLNKTTMPKKTIDLKNIQTCELPIDFDEYYATCIYPADKGNCKIRYPKYSFEKENELTVYLKQNGFETLPNEYIFLPSLKNKEIRPIILCFTETDIEKYIFVTTQNNKIIATLEIGNMADNETKWFHIDENYKITLFKRKTEEEQKTLMEGIYS